MRSINEAASNKTKYVATVIKKHEQETEEREKARVAETTKIWSIP